MLPHFLLFLSSLIPFFTGALSLTFKTKSPYHEIRKGPTDMNQSWILPFDLSPFYCYPSDSASDFGKLHAPGKAQRGNIWAELSRHASILQSRCWWCELGLVPWALTASLFLINTTCAECESSLQWVEVTAVWTQLLALHSGDKDKDDWKGGAGTGLLNYWAKSLVLTRDKRSLMSHLNHINPVRPTTVILQHQF